MTDDQLFPRWVKRPDGAELTVTSRADYRAHMGVEFESEPEPSGSPLAEDDPLGIHMEDIELADSPQAQPTEV
jgi:hypothetical protein